MALTRRENVPPPVDAGQALPLPLPRESDGRAAPLPVPREGEGRATPLPLTPREPGAPGESDGKTPSPRETFSITKAALDYYYDRAEGHFVRLNNMSAALKLAAREVKARIVKTGDTFDLKPPSAFESYLESRALRKRDGAPQNSPDLETRRRDWDEAKRSGDPDAMTRTANALIRAVDRSPRHVGARQAAPGARADEHDVVSEILNPRARSESVAETAVGFHAGVRSQELQRTDLESLANERLVRVPDESSSGQIAQRGEGNADDAIVLTREQAGVAADAIADASPSRRSEILQMLGRQFEDASGDAPVGLQRVRASELNADASARSGGLPPDLRGRQQDFEVQESVGYGGDTSYVLPWRSNVEVWPPMRPRNTESRRPGVPEKFQAGAWREDYMPMTEGGSVLVDKDFLPPEIRRNLEQREWRSPTGEPPGESLYLGWGYFGAPRGTAPNQKYHGALDFPGNDVVMPTRARLVAITYSKTVGWTLKFDLGDGVQMALLHMVPSEETLRRYVAGDTNFDIGQQLGTVDRFAYGTRNDHVHMQIKLGPGRYRGQRVDAFVVNPTPFFPASGWVRPY